jgi:micrococcal nuclease
MPKRVYLAVLLACLLLGACGPAPDVALTSAPHTSAAPYPRSTLTPHPSTVTEPRPGLVLAHCVRVVDGDTIEVSIDGRVYKVRYIGMDTPETVHPQKPVQWMGPEATAANRRLVEGRDLYLEKDVSETDKYGRLLRYVYVAAISGELIFVNVELVRQGYAQVSTYPPDVRYQDVLLAAQWEARAAGRGLWGARPVPTVVTGPISPTPAQPAACDCGGNLYNCADFPTQAAAQACYRYCWSMVGRDVHRLDGDGDGVACEQNP